MINLFKYFSSVICSADIHRQGFKLTQSSQSVIQIKDSLYFPLFSGYNLIKMLQYRSIIDITNQFCKTNLSSKVFVDFRISLIFLYFYDLYKMVYFNLVFSSNLTI